MIRKDINKVVRKGDLTKIENYDKAVADKNQTWICHHRLELTLDGEFAHTAEELDRMGMYYNRPYFELIFLTPAEHGKLHGETMSDEHKKNLSEALKGRKFSEEHRKNIGKASKGRKPSEETKKKISEAIKRLGYKPRSEFSRKYFEYFGYSRAENKKQYYREARWYRVHNHRCSWEIEDEVSKP